MPLKAVADLEPGLLPLSDGLPLSLTVYRLLMICDNGTVFWWNHRQFNSSDT